MSAIWDYLSGPDDPEALARAAEAAGRPGAGRLKAALAEELACSECRERLVAYAQAADEGAPLSPDLAAAARHLEGCTECAAEYVELQALSRAAESGHPAGVPVPVPDLSFLPASSPTLADLWEQISAANRRLALELRVVISRTAAEFRALPAGLLPQPVPVPILRDSTRGISAQRLMLPPAPGNLLIELTVTPGGQPAQVAVRLMSSDSQQAPARATVTLLNAERRRLRRSDTDAAGRAVFSELAPGRYYLRVRSGSEDWELSLVLEGEDPAG